MNVFKFGGASIKDADSIRNLIPILEKYIGYELVIVVSAMGKMTDNLMVTISQLGGVSDADYAEIISMGERISARIFSSALKALGAQAVFIDPVNTNWPIITDSNYRNAEPSLKETKNRVQRFLIPLLGATIPVVCGFLGKDDEGKITTLGRGGSDTTALLLANFVDADETILVKDTSGVLSADPKIFPRARPIDKLDVHEMFDLVQGGAKIVKAEALKYKPPNQKLRVVSFSSENIARGGTEITGSLNTDSVKINSLENLLEINVVCEVNSRNLMEIFSLIKQKPIYGVSSGKRSVTVFTTDGDVNGIIERLHSVKGLKAISHREKVAMLQVVHPSFIDSPGYIAGISSALSQKGINILEVTTSKASINVFIEGNELQSAIESIGEIVES